MMICMNQHLKIVFAIFISFNSFAQKDSVCKSLSYALEHPLEIINLELVGQELDSLPEAIGELVNLKYLLLEDNKLTYLPMSICKLTKLEDLGLDGNLLTELPQCIGELTKLKYLGLDENKLTVFSISILELANLEELYLNQNQITQLPDSIGKLSKLIYLEFAENEITILPNSIGDLIDLESIYLSDNAIVKFPDSLAKLVNLETFIYEDPIMSEEEKDRLKKMLPLCDFEFRGM